MKANVLIVDPPWNFDDKLTAMKRPVKRSSSSQYGTLTIDELCTLPVPQIVDPMGCVIALWVPSTLLVDGLILVNRWGFKFKQTFVWVKLKKDHEVEDDPNMKTRVGMGRLFRQAHELALIGTCGPVYRMLASRSQRSVAMDLNAGHSQKPDTLHERLEEMFPVANRVELFARRQRPGWTCVGDEIDGIDIRDSLQALATV